MSNNTHAVGLPEAAVKIIKKYAKENESMGETALRLFHTADGRLTATRKWAKAHPPKKAARKAVKRNAKARKPRAARRNPRVEKANGAVENNAPAAA